MPTTKKIGKEHHNRGDRRRENRHGYFAGGIQIASHRSADRVQVTLNIFQFDDRIIDQTADAERQPAQVKTFSVWS